jgi:protein-L-isoaspartate(D-aspartate) O-methyltransferase
MVDTRRPVPVLAGLRALLAVAIIALSGCADRPLAARADGDADRTEERRRMVKTQIIARGVKDERVLDAMRSVRRHAFVPAGERAYAYADRPLPIGFEQTISQPYIVAVMSEALKLDGSERVLEIGTGSGYQAAVLAKLAAEVYSIEIVPGLAARARKTLEREGFERVHLRVGDGYRGWPEAAPFDAIILTAAPDHVPQPLIDQLAVGGRMVLPVGRRAQELVLITKTETGLERETIALVRFVPMTGEAQQGERP